jgi:hypothetical protein
MRTKKTSLKLTSPARQSGETIEQCRERRKKEKGMIKLFLRGYLVGYKPKAKKVW